ncbi:NmrA domain-containing protein [Rhizoctonia solani AG-1 IA]|uniref:NmrA domain-containing protein n=1 Tax=Thanatephorus cucumeris (strain AG1-IA) TaxID=983506 RepID=L8X935_THACA|nr:NmrA domain-containing protein [Rhizoctonia solani AG-1 IA]
MFDKKIIAVCGATGELKRRLESFQGGSTIKHLLRDGRFAVRGLTRKPDSANAKALSTLGVEVVRGDFDDVDSLISAFRGCYGVFGVTDYFEAFDKEAQQGINIVDAAKAAGVEHLVLSAGAENDPPVVILEHNYSCSLSSGFWCSLDCVFYFVLLQQPHLIRCHDPGSSNGWMEILSSIPNRHTNAEYITQGYWRICKLLLELAPLGRSSTWSQITAAFTNPEEWIGKDMNIVNEYITPREYADIFAEVTCSDHELDHRFKWFIDQHDKKEPYYDVQLAKRLCPDNQSFEDYVKEYREVPPEQPTMIQCYRTQERFVNSPMINQYIHLHAIVPRITTLFGNGPNIYITLDGSLTEVCWYRRILPCATQALFGAFVAHIVFETSRTSAISDRPMAVTGNAWALEVDVDDISSSQGGG